MTEQQLKLIQDSWLKIMPNSSETGHKFYSRLFEINPDLQHLFTGDMHDQVNKLMAMINLAVSSLTNLESMIPTIQALGKYHVSFGVKEEYYDNVGEALIWTLADGFGDEFTDDLRDAWTEVYTTLSSVMKDAAYHNHDQVKTA